MQFRTKLLRVMKITALLMIASALQVYAGAWAQKTISLHGTNMPLEQAIIKIKDQTGLLFIYNDKDIAKTKPITVDLKEVALTDALEEIFKDQPLTFEIQGNTVFLITRKNSLPPGEHGLPSDIDIQGRVTDSTGRPLEGASVTVKGKKGTGTTTIL